MESIFYFLKKVSRHSVVTDLNGYNRFPQTNTPLSFYQPQTACYNGWLQQVL